MCNAAVGKKSVSGRIKFLVGVGSACLLAIGSVWVLGPRTVVGSVGTAVLLILFWPVVLFLFGLIVGLVASLLAGDDAGVGEVAEAGIMGGWRYYSYLMSVRNPYFWGGLVGAALAVAFVYLYVVKFVEPKEFEARKQVKAIAAILEEHRRQTGCFPTAKGKYLHEALDIPSTGHWQGRPLVDPWGRPLMYEREGDTYAEYFRVTCTGWDGRRDVAPSKGDDIAEEGTGVDKGALTKELLRLGKEKTINYLKNRLKARELQEPKAQEQ